MKPTLKALVVVVAAFAIIGGVFSKSAPALAQTIQPRACQWTREEET